MQDFPFFFKKFRDIKNFPKISAKTQTSWIYTRKKNPQKIPLMFLKEKSERKKW
jgi:hypothetical protein